MNARGWFSAFTVRCGWLVDSRPNGGKLLGMVGATAYEAGQGSRSISIDTIVPWDSPPLHTNDVWHRKISALTQRFIFGGIA